MSRRDPVPASSEEEEEEEEEEEDEHAPEEKKQKQKQKQQKQQQKKKPKAITVRLNTTPSSEFVVDGAVDEGILDKPVLGERGAARTVGGTGDGQ
jgi:hypothetical protein